MFGFRHGLCEHGCGLLIGAKLAQQSLVRQNGQESLVRVQCVRSRARGQYPSPVLVGLPQDGAGIGLQVKIRQAIVDKVHRIAVHQQPRSFLPELLRACDHCVYAVFFEHLFEQRKFRTQVLLRWMLIHNGDPPQLGVR